MRGYNNCGEDSSGINEDYEKEFEEDHETENDVNGDDQPSNEKRGKNRKSRAVDEPIDYKGKGRHIPESERITLVSLVKTLDKERLLTNKKVGHMSYETIE